jgi:UDP-N-acetylglucosamine 2-epimerase (non-hydrolysing)
MSEANKPLVTIVLGTRPEAIKLAPVIQAFQEQPDFRTRVVLTGQHREMVAQVMELFGIQADHDLALMAPKQTLTHITCAALQGLKEDFAQHRPDLVLVQGDSTTAFASALAAFYEQIPVGHVEAGLRTDNLFDPFPEEANRRLISQVAQLHFAPTEVSAANCRASGVVGEVCITGNTVIDALLLMAEKAPPFTLPGLDFEQHRVILATVHRRENWGERLQEIGQGFLQVLERFPDTALLLPLHRNPTVREPLQALLGDHPRAFLTEPLDYDRLVAAMRGCTLLLSDSGGLPAGGTGPGQACAGAAPHHRAPRSGGCRHRQADRHRQRRHPGRGEQPAQRSGGLSGDGPSPQSLWRWPGLRADRGGGSHSA